MKKFFKNYKRDLIFLVIIILVSVFFRVIGLDKIPTNISGDEVTNLSDVYKIIFGKGISFYSFMGDGSVAGINFYWSSLFINFFGLEKTIFALRFSIATLSILSLIPFYLLLREEVTPRVSFIFTILLSANFVFLNFSRTAWINMGIVFTGLFLILFLEKALKENHLKWFLLSGFFAGLTLYGYHYGRIMVLSLFLYLFLLFLKKEKRKIIYFKGVFLTIFVAFLVFLPFLINIFKDHGEAILRRPIAAYAFPQNINIFQHQVEYTLKGFILLDGSVVSEGIENMRYLPFHNPPVNIFIKILFLAGLVYFVLFERKFTIWLVVLVSILLTQIASSLPPNFSRGIFYLPFVYFISAIFFYKIWTYSRCCFPKNPKIIYLFALFFTGLLFFYDTNRYFQWMGTEEIYTARQPAIDYKEFPVWQDFQIKRVKLGRLPVTNYEWYEIRKSFGH
ncbi:MAG: glycosyltransferase family 39 protein [bacterium]|nr:glycosyltransferase family 39 protein [bacterium]